MNDESKLPTEDVFQSNEETVLTPDWTESEWFEVWLKLARGEYETASK